MISSFKDDFTEQVFHSGDRAKIPRIDGRALAKAQVWLDRLNDAGSPHDLDLHPDQSLRD
ncbi:MAG: hypothetical protein A2527_14655 [Candidatus Lambdaproteobacteria bacterium RIFOXYD2_FULL_50_16]|uniref:Uncharacterized protein n=1 Tax=Candidatus Lambdaproteobacteria bacterium RIFOXYD2_FULL_50_16 TaxID=1817772 RepID=A0A1F6G864_9PROT|nr:MAG: hypothetical protein A2527_14655 [Candidatus Lambdaproteobacteria bacterium RIFOXYD2_FULL_50_16]